MNKKLLFFTKINFGNSQNTGYWNKVNSQADAIRKQGWAVDLIYINDNEIRLKTSEGISSTTFKSRLNLLYNLFIVSPCLLKKEKYTAVYIRHFLTNPLFLIFLHKMRSQLKTIVMEVPTYPYSFEYKGINKNRLLYLIDRFCSLFFKLYIDRIVSFSFDKYIFKIATISTDNGVDVASIKYTDTAPAFTGKLRILGLGNPRIWHAYERVIAGLYEYYQTRKTIDVVFEIVGQGGELEKYKLLTEKYGLQDKIIFHGYKSGEELDVICKQCHVAVASLGMHRINVANGEASPLKAREFAARGILFLTGYTDKGFPLDFPFVLNFPADESPINIDRVLLFYTNILNKYPDYTIQMRKYALDNLDWSSKMKPVVDYFNQADSSL
ncbi:MAG TPA: glycosyltransferase [Saprospiraceae bacterium]|nr:glycosyltransferase [Saprospiraceae bacterium]